MSRRLIVLIAILLIITQLPFIAFGDDDDRDVGGNVGEGDSQLKTGEGLKWNACESGYRLTIIDKDYKPVSNKVDLVYKNPLAYNFGSGDKDWYTSCRAETLGISQTDYSWRVIDDLFGQKKYETCTKPPGPIVSAGDGKGTYIGQGRDFKEWFLRGKEGTIPSSYVTPSKATIGSKPKTTSGTTKPSLVLPDRAEYKVKDINMDGVNYSTIAYSKNYAEVKKIEALDIIKEYSESSSIKVVERSRRDLNDLMINIEGEYNRYYSSSGNDGVDAVSKAQPPSIKEIVTKVLSKALINIENTTYTSLNAESVYRYAYIVNKLREDNKFGQYVVNDTDIDIDTYIASSNDLINEISTMYKIPLSDGEYDPEVEGYYRIVLNMTDNDGYIFKFKGDTSDKNPHQIIVENDYSVMVEPIFWFNPSNYAGGKVVAPTHPNYVYGTVGNHIDFSANNGYRYGPTGGAYSSLQSKVGWRCMYMENDWVGNGVTITGYTGALINRTLKDIKENSMDKGVGVAMHMYGIKPVDVSQRTWDYESPNEIHPAPDPSDLDIPTGELKQYKIVKYYELEKLDGMIDYSAPQIRDDNPPKIEIMHEIDYRVEDWFITKNTSNGSSKYQDSKSSLGYTRSGSSAEIVQVNKDKDGEMALHVLLVKKEGELPEGEITIYESEISKAVTTLDTSLDGWGKRTFNFECGSMSGSDTHYCGAEDCSGHSCSAKFGDSSYEYIIKNSAEIDDLMEANSAGGAFKFKLLNNTKKGNIPLTGGKNSIKNAEYQTVIWRALDIPTISSYKEKSTIDLKSLLKRYDKKPAGDRAGNGVYMRYLAVQLAVDKEASDLKTHSIHSYNSKKWHEKTHTYNTVDNHEAEVIVQTYSGNNNKSKGSDTKTGEIPTVTPFGAVTSMHSTGYMVQGDIPIQFYPYIRMTYQVTGDSKTSKKDVNVLSQYYSEVLPNDFAEAAWYNENENESLLLSSTQWSLHAKAVSGGNSWNGKNKVLPGGAIYQLGTGKNPSKISLITWQTIVQDPERKALTVDLPANEYTTSRADIEHKNFVQLAKAVINRFRIVQWVNGDVNAINAWTNNGKSLKIREGGESLSPLGLTGNTSTESKYHIRSGGEGGSSNEGDLDIISETDSTDTFFKVFADTSGNVYLAKSVGSISALKDINGTNKSGSGVTVTKILSKNSSNTSSLSGDAGELDKRTLLITNFVKALERNAGNDKTASWATSDGKWYNEAWDGIIVVRKATTMEVGLDKPSIRSAALDPRLCPASSGKADMFDKAFLSQFRLDSKSTLPSVQSKPDGYIGTFRGKDIILRDLESMYQSKKFYIPNVNVQDI